MELNVDDHKSWCLFFRDIITQTVRQDSLCGEFRCLFVFLCFLGWGRKLLKCWTSEPETLPDDWQEVPAMRKWISSQQNAVKSHERRPPEESEREECWCDLLEPGTRETLIQTYWPIFHFSSFHISTHFFIDTFHTQFIEMVQSALDGNSSSLNETISMHVKVVRRWGNLVSFYGYWSHSAERACTRPFSDFNFQH